MPLPPSQDLHPFPIPGSSQFAQKTCGFFTAQVEHKLPHAVVKKVWFFLPNYEACRMCANPPWFEGSSVQNIALFPIQTGGQMGSTCFRSDLFCCLLGSRHVVATPSTRSGLTVCSDVRHANRTGRMPPTSRTQGLRLRRPITEQQRRGVAKPY